MIYDIYDNHDNVYEIVQYNIYIYIYFPARPGMYNQGGTLCDRQFRPMRLGPCKNNNQQQPCKNNKSKKNKETLESIEREG